MSDQLPVRPERAATIGQDIIKMLIKEPVKEAVREALLEEQIREETYTEQLSRTQGEDSDSGGRSIPTKTLVIVGIAGAILLMRRVRSDNSGGGISGEIADQRQGTTARPTE